MGNRLGLIFVRTSERILECEQMLDAQRAATAQGGDHPIAQQILRALECTHAMLKTHCDEQRRALGIAQF
jgi:hypothetical protein